MTEHEPTSALTEGVASTREDFECVPSRSDSIATIRLSDCPSSSQSSSLPASATEPTRPPSSIVGFEQTDREPSERIQNLDLDPIHVDNTNDSGILPSESAAQRPGPGQSVPLDLEAETHTRPRSSSSSTQTSVHSGEVNWDELERSEEQEARDESSDEVCHVSGFLPREGLQILILPSQQRYFWRGWNRKTMHWLPTPNQAY